MPKQKVDAKGVIKTALKIFRSKGYYNTSMKDIGSACDLKKGSLYHYFPSKDKLMMAVIEHLHSYYKRKVFALAYEEDKTPRERLLELGDISEKQFFNADSGCMMGFLALEVANGSLPEVTPLVREFFDEWKNALHHLFKFKYDNETAEHIAKASVAGIEGAVMMMRLYNDQTYLKVVHQTILEKFDGKSV